MSLGTLLERLVVAVTADTDGFSSGMAAMRRTVREAANGMGRDITNIGNRLTSLGNSLTVAVTAPLAAAGYTLVKSAAMFEKSMINVGAAAQTSGKKIDDMATKARALGTAWDYGATEVADATEAFIKNGRTIEDALGGAIDSIVIMSRAAGEDLSVGVDTATDVMNNFNKKGYEMMDVANQVTGTLIASKYGLRDYQLALGMAGGAAGVFGVSFEDFNAVLAATASSFTSGSDAGTSFKVMLTRFVPQSKKAAEAMKQYGLEFYDASGKMKDMATIADMLKDKLGGLNDEARNKALKDIFGIDAMREAAAFVKVGGDGIRKVREEISKTNAVEMAAAKQGGLIGHLRDLKAAWQELGIAMGEAGILDAVTNLVKGITALVTKMGELPQPVLNAMIALAGIAMVVGPLIGLIGNLVRMAGGIVQAFEVGGLFAAGGALAGIGEALGAVGAAIGAVAAPVLIALAAATAFYFLFKKQLDPVIKEFVDNFKKTLGPAFKDAGAAISDAVSAIVEQFNLFTASPVGKFVEYLIGIIGEFAGVILSTLGVTVIAVLKTFLHVVENVFHIVAEAIRFVGSLLRLDFPEAWKHLQGVFMGVLKLLGQFVADIMQGIVDTVGKMILGVEGWLVKRFQEVVKKCKDLVGEVVNAFAFMWDAVIGHSYVPDMIKGIEHWFARLDAGMVKPAKNATDKVKEDFKQLADEVQAVLDKLRSPMEVLQDDFNKDIDKLNRGLKAGVLTPQEYEDARQKRSDQFNRDTTPELQKVSVDNNPAGFEPAGKFADEYMARMKEHSDEMRTWFASTFADGVEAGLSGNGKEFLKDWVKAGFTKALNDLGTWIFDKLGAGNSNSPWGQVINAASTVFGGARASGGPVMGGRAYMVGERGPEIMVPGRSGSIVPNHSLGGKQTTLNFYAEDAVLTSTVKTWIMDGMRMAEGSAVSRSVRASTEVVPVETARRQSRSMW